MEELLVYITENYKDETKDKVDCNMEEIKENFLEEKIFSCQKDYEKIHSIFCELIDNKGILGVEEEKVDGLYITNLNCIITIFLCPFAL